MAISKNPRIQRIEVYPASDESASDTSNAKHPHIMAVYEDVIDDPDDDDLPVVATRTKHIHKYVEDGGALSDYSSELQLVQDICSELWS